MKKLLLLLALLVSCSGEPATEAPATPPPAAATTIPEVNPEATAAVPEATAVPSEAPAETATEAVEAVPEPPPVPVDHAGLPLPTGRNELFAGSGACTSCHNQMVDEAGVDVSIGDFWRSTMMANAARDPYWQAAVQAEISQAPELQGVLEDKCSTCHTPMARYTAVTAGAEGELYEGGYFNPDNDLHALGMDGVSCTLCHQIEPKGQGQPAVDSGNFVIDVLSSDQRVIYGPLPVTEPNAQLMQSVSGFVPVESKHVKQATLCASCHTLYTPYVNAAGEISGEFPEQTPFLEWAQSDYAQSQSCQACHMPRAQGSVALSTIGGEPRQPFFQHNFVGGNAFMLRILQFYGEERQVTAATEHFEATIGRVHDQVENRTASVSIEGQQVSDGRLSVEIVISSQAGHKFPTGFPSRRAWLHVTMTGGDGQVIFESGATRADGSIVGNDNDDDAGRFEPHYAVLSTPDQVQIYEPVMQNTDGEVTTTLLRGASYIKDNRLLPAGMSKESAPEDVAVYGAALADGDFGAGGDRVRYEIELNGAAGPFTLQVELLYQSVGYRWMENLRGYDEAEEVARFLAYTEVVPNAPLLVASATAEIE